MLGWIRRYGIALLCVLLAILALAKVKIAGLDYSEQEIILALLGLLAIDNLAERTGILNNVLNRLNDLSRRIPRQGDHHVVMTRRNQVPRLADVVEAARREVILVGPSLDTVVGMAGRLEEVARAGVRIKIMLSAPIRESVQRYADHMVFDNWVSPDDGEFRLAIDHLRNNYRILHRSLEAGGDGRVEIRLTEKMIFCSYVIIDPTLRSGSLAAHFHMYKMPVDMTPFVQLERTTDGEWFSFFLSAFERAWQDSRPVTDQDRYGPPPVQRAAHDNG
ncbi:hypothetical protein FHG89_32510 [Micromonospora orduensis]|uniref:Uncharacterized protein n=1 Tax=Micromonospora orduensis TaxID=1420891 RepID=A0A5C4QFP9_9ACTN|nr:hypothetical protein [Micromonospora orduensis]TNH21030.1 hypothetical protein FHG89_32510 [Micromonospora orduensis]